MIERKSKTWATDKIRKYMPTREAMAANKYLKPIAHRFLCPELWRFTRRSVPRGVALGLFTAFIIPIGQIFLAAFLALPVRANVPLSALVTFVTNPLTLPFWLLVANRVGRVALNIDATMGGGAGSLAEDGGALANWLQLGGETAIGFVILAMVAAAIGYLLSAFVWRLIVLRKRRKRLARMEQRLVERLKSHCP